MTCKAKTKSGKRCKNTPQEGGYCHVHQNDKNLTNKQIVFAETYMQCWNATESARQAGYKGNISTLTSIGHENLTKPDIREYIKERMDEISMGTDEIIGRLTAWGRGTLEPFLQKDDYSEALNVSSDGAKQHIGLIKKIKQDETALQTETENGDTVLKRKFEIEIHDAKDAVIQLAKIRGLYVDRVKHEGSIGGVLISPQPQSPEEWAENVVAYQNKIKELQEGHGSGEA